MNKNRKAVRLIYLIPTLFFLVISAYAIYSFPHTSKNVEIDGNTIFVPDGEQIVLSRYRVTIVLVPDDYKVSQSIWLVKAFHIKDVTVTDQLQVFDFQKFFRSDINDGLRLKIQKVDGGIEIIIPDGIKIW